MTTVFQKNIASTQRPASTIKLMNALVFQDWVTSGLLDTTVAVSGSDTVDWATDSNAGLISGDVLSYRDLLYGSLLPSGNDAAKCIARHVGALIIAGAGPGSSSDPVTRFVQAMNAKSAAIGLSTAVFADPSGVSLDNLMSAADLALIMVAVASDPLLVAVAGTMTRGLSVTGPNARTQAVTHTVWTNVKPGGAVPTPEFLAGKTGTVYYAGADAQYNSGGCLAVYWETPSGAKRVTAILGAGLPDPIRYQDLRKLIDFELARMGEL